MIPFWLGLAGVAALRVPLFCGKGGHRLRRAVRPFLVCCSEPRSNPILLDHLPSLTFELLQSLLGGRSESVVSSYTKRSEEGIRGRHLLRLWVLSKSFWWGRPHTSFSSGSKGRSLSLSTRRFAKCFRLRACANRRVTHQNGSMPALCLGILAAANLYSLLLYLVPGDRRWWRRDKPLSPLGPSLCRSSYM